MPATKTNYLVLFSGESQVYSSGSKEVAMKSPPPEGKTLDDKRVFFISHHPDTNEVLLHEIPREEVNTAEIEYSKPRKKKLDEHQQD